MSVNTPLTPRPSISYVVVLTAGVTTKICGPANDRTAITFSASTNPITILAEGTNQGGLVVSPFAGASSFCQCHLGDWVKRAMTAFSAGGDTLLVVEAFEPDYAALAYMKMMEG